MPCWWPNHLIDWMQIKNLSHRYEGYLGNTYSNCLRIAVIRGYAHYGLDANDFVEKQNGKSSTKLSSNGLLTSTPQHQVSNNGLNDRITVEPIAYADEVKANYFFGKMLQIRFLHKLAKKLRGSLSLYLLLNWYNRNEFSILFSGLSGFCW